MTETRHIVCSTCGATNRIPQEKMQDNPVCGKCGQPVLRAEPVKLTAENYQQHINRNEIPVVVDFWASWCGPCKMMGPAFEQASAELLPKARLAKLNTEDEQMIAGQMNIRSIPTMVIFKAGREVARQSGAMSAQDIKSWVLNHI